MVVDTILMKNNNDDNGDDDLQTSQERFYSNLINASSSRKICNSV